MCFHWKRSKTTSPSVIEGLSPVSSCDSLETVLIHDTYNQSDNHNN